MQESQVRNCKSASLKKPTKVTSVRKGSRQRNTKKADELGNNEILSYYVSKRGSKQRAEMLAAKTSSKPTKSKEASKRASLESNKTVCNISCN